MGKQDDVENQLPQDDDWASRRKKGIPPNKRLFVLSCMDERIPLEQLLNLELGDAHIFRNAGGVVTDDVIRSAAITIHFFNTREIIIVNHTDCGMLSASGEQVTAAIEEKTSVDLSEISLDPDLPDFKFSRETIHRWWKMHTSLDEASKAQVEAFRNHPLIPDHVEITSYVYEVESGHLSMPGDL